MTEPRNTEGAVYDLGYKPYEGDRLGRRATIAAVVRDGVRRVLGFRRKARRKVLPWSLIGIALAPAMFFVGVGVIAGEFFEGDTEFFGHAQYFNLTGGVTLLFVALAGSELLVPDRVDGVLQVYASRPLRRVDYLWARAAALGGVVLAFSLTPALLLWIGQGAISSKGLFASLSGNLDTLWNSVLAALVYVAAYGPPALLVAAFAAKTTYAAGIYVGVMLVSGAVTSGFVDEANIDAFGLLALGDHPGYVKDWLFDANTGNWIPERADFDPWVSLLVIAVLALISAAAVATRYRRLL